MSYCTLQDIYDLGFTAKGFVIVPRAWNPDNGRSGDAINTSTGVIRMAGHGYSATDLVEFVLTGNANLPGNAAALPGGTTTGVLLYPLPIDFFRFQLSTSQGGSPVTFSSAGSGWALQLDPERRLQRHADDGQSRIDRALVAQAPPIKVDPITGKYPAEIIGINARLAARSAIPSLQFENAAHREAADRVMSAEKADEKMLEEWSMGKPLLPQAVDQDTIADNAIRARGARPIGWGNRRSL